MGFDTFLDTINAWGKFQKVKYAIICLTYMLPPITLYSYGFAAAKPLARCLNPSMNLTDDSYSPDANKKFNDAFKPTNEQCRNYSGLMSENECQSCYVRVSMEIHEKTNQPRLPIEPCSKYVYDKTYFKETLVEEWNMVCDRLKLRSGIQITFFFGHMVGSVVFGILADRYGRRPVMSISFILLSFAGLLCAIGPQRAFGTVPSYIIFVAGRFLLACATRGVSVSGFVLGSEIVGPKQRLFVGIVIEYFFAFGELFLLLFAYFVRTWRALILSISLFTVPYILFYFILPESPRWLVCKGRFSEAETILRYIAKKNNREFDEHEFEKLKQEQTKSNEQQHQVGIRSLFQSKIMLMISINLFFQWLAQNLVFYGVSQNTASWGPNPYVNFGLSALVEIAGYAVVQLTLDRIGRKIPYVSFSILFSLTAVLILPAKKYLPKDSKVESVVIIIINAIEKFFASASYATIYIYANELFPTNVRNTGMGMCSMIARIGGMIGTYCNDSLSRIWPHLPGLLYGLVSMIAGVLALAFPETLNRPLPQCAADVENMRAASLGSKTVRSTTIDIPTIVVCSEEDTNQSDLKKDDPNDPKI